MFQPITILYSPYIKFFDICVKNQAFKQTSRFKHDSKNIHNIRRNGLNQHVRGSLLNLKKDRVPASAPGTVNSIYGTSGTRGSGPG